MKSFYLPCFQAVLNNFRNKKVILHFLWCFQLIVNWFFLICIYESSPTYIIPTRSISFTMGPESVWIRVWIYRVSVVDSGGAEGARAPLEFKGSEKRTEREISRQSIAASPPGFGKLSIALYVVRQWLIIQEPAKSGSRFFINIFSEKKKVY